MVELLQRMLNVDRRVIFILIIVAVIVPLFISYKQTIVPDKAAVQFYNSLKKLEQKKVRGEEIVVLISGQMDPGTVPELVPMARAALIQLLRMDAKIIIMGLWPQGPPLIMEAFNELLKKAEFRNKKYGVDYVNLGYTVGGSVVIKGFTREIRDKYPVDANGTELDELPIMKNIHNFDDIDVVINLSAGMPGSKEWVQFAKKTTEDKMVIISGCTAVQAPEAYPYLNAGQIKGLLGGLKGAADYEALLNEPNKATKYMFAQSIAHIVIMLFIIFGNVAYFLTRKKQQS